MEWKGCRVWQNTKSSSRSSLLYFLTIACLRTALVANNTNYPPPLLVALHCICVSIWISYFLVACCIWVSSWNSYFYNCSSLYLCFRLEFIFLYSLFTGFLCPAAIPISVFVGSSLCLCFRLDFIPLYLYFTERILPLTTTVFDLHKNASLHVISIL